jgi:hypothetical protein
MIPPCLNNDVDVTSKVNPQAIKALRMLCSKNDALLTVDSLDYFIHNKFIFPKRSDLEELWVQLEPLLSFLCKKEF